MVFKHFRFEVVANRTQPRLGIIAPRAFGNAPTRNRLKRWQREAFRRCRAQLPPVDIVVMPRHGLKETSWQAVESDWQALAAKLQASEA